MIVNLGDYVGLQQELQLIEQETRAIEIARREQLEQFLTRMLAELEAA